MFFLFFLFKGVTHSWLLCTLNMWLVFLGQIQF